MKEIRCPNCGRLLGEMGCDVAFFREGGRQIVVREILSLQCDKCRCVWTPRMPKAETLDMTHAQKTENGIEKPVENNLKLGDVFSSDLARSLKKAA